jgi:hypothetical protein
MGRQTDIAALIKTVTLNEPQDLLVTTSANGAAVDRAGIAATGLALSGELHLSAGAETGGISAVSAEVALEQSADGSTGWTAYNDETGAQYKATVTAVSTEARTAVNLKGADKFIRGVLTDASTGGISLQLQASIALGGFDVAAQA